MKIGIPRAFLYYRYGDLWKTFLEELEVDYIVSPETTKDMVQQGMHYAIDEACLSSKVYLGHVSWLLDRCDAILIPRITHVGNDGIVCTKFMAMYDIVASTFRDRKVNLLYYNVDDQDDGEMGAFLKMGKFLGRKKARVAYAYLVAKQAERAMLLQHVKEQQTLLQSKQIKILLVGHAYNVYDKYVGAPVLRALQEMGAVPVLADKAPKKEAVEASYRLSDSLPWAFNRELVGAIELYRHQVDGIILMSTFPCGPDSLVNDIILRRVKDKPILNLMMDGQEGSAGMETRLESFIDIIQFKREDYHA